MRTNVKAKGTTAPGTLYTHEGAIAKRIDAEAQLRRSVLACLLFESGFYEDGASIAERIAEEVTRVEPEVVSKLAVEARTRMKLRHVPLLLCREMARHPEHRKFVGKTIAEVIQRPDEISEFLSMYWTPKRCPICPQVKRGLARAFEKFEEWQLAKWDRDGAVKLRDVLFMVHGRTKDTRSKDGVVRIEEAIRRKGYRRGQVARHEEAACGKLVEGKLLTPDTWEVRISAAKTKEERRGIWEDLIERGRLGALALLRNLRNMEQDGVEREIVKVALAKMSVDRVLPFRFISAARYAPQLEPDLEAAMFRALQGEEKLLGSTALVIDNSGSMDHKLSAKSELTRRDAACALAILVREICEDVAVVAFSNSPALVPPRRGMALAEAITKATEHGGTYTERALELARRAKPDRIIVVTDEQSHQTIGGPGEARGYFINVASAQNGIGYGQWAHVDGMSEAVVNWIREYEKEARKEA